jgi:hypothetical protein
MTTLMIQLKQPDTVLWSTTVLIHDGDPHHQTSSSLSRLEVDCLTPQEFSTQEA